MNYNYYQGDASGFMGTLLAISGFITILSLVIGIFSIVVMWKMFKKAGKKGWEALIPFYNTYVLFEITWGNGWLFLTSLLAIIPFFGTIAVLVINILTMLKLAKSFGKSTGFGIGLIFLGIIFMTIIAFDKSTYLGVPKKSNSESSNSNDNQQGYQPVNNTIPTVNQFENQQQNIMNMASSESTIPTPLTQTQQVVEVPEVIQNHEEPINNEMQLNNNLVNEPANSINVFENNSQPVNQQPQPVVNITPVETTIPTEVTQPQEVVRVPGVIQNQPQPINETSMPINQNPLETIPNNLNQQPTIDNSVYCAYCGTKVNDNIDTCPHCGNKVIK